MERKNLLPRLQEPTTCPFINPDHASPCPFDIHVYFFKFTSVSSLHQRLDFPDGLVMP
jgi:hypothetical protein